MRTKRPALHLATPSLRTNARAPYRNGLLLRWSCLVRMGRQFGKHPKLYKEGGMTYECQSTTTHRQVVGLHRPPRKGEMSLCPNTDEAQGASTRNGACITLPITRRTGNRCVKAPRQRTRPKPGGS